MEIINTIIVAIALIVLLRGGRYFLNLAARNKRYHSYVLRIFPWIEVILWFIFIFWTITLHFENTRIYPVLSGGLVVIFLLLFGWFVLRDFFAGAVIRAGQELEQGIFIKADTFSGTIISLGYIAMEIRTGDGEKLIVPYSRLAGKQITKMAQHGRGKNQTIKLEIHQKHGAQNIQQSLKRKVLELPWVIAGEEIKVSLLPFDNCYVAEISFQSMKEDMLPATEEILRDFATQEFSPD
jgi:small-conductance mechanosensitive channel